MNRLQAKVSIVTGGSLGIGQAVATRMAEEGAKVAILDVLSEEGKGKGAIFSRFGREILAVRGSKRNARSEHI